MAAASSAGVATALKESKPGVRVYGVEPEGSEAVSLAIKAGEVVRIDPVSVADGLGAPFAGEWTLPICARYLDDIVLLDDPTILGGLRFAAERMKQVLEPAGAAALAAVLHGRIPIRDGERVLRRGLGRERRDDRGSASSSRVRSRASRARSRIRRSTSR